VQHKASKIAAAQNRIELRHRIERRERSSSAEEEREEKRREEARKKREPIKIFCSNVVENQTVSLVGFHFLQTMTRGDFLSTFDLR
jgi:hypothetical protein